MSIVLGIECSTPICSVAVYDGHNVLGVKEDEGLGKHSEVLTLYIREALNQAGVGLRKISYLAVGDGPGSYTGLRIGSSAAKAFCFIRKVPLLAIPTINALAETSFNSNPSQWHLSIMDARRNDAYVTLISPSGEKCLEKEFVTLDEEFYSKLHTFSSKFTISGDFEKISRLYPKMECTDSNIRPSALNFTHSSSYMIENQQFENHMLFQPFYLHSPNITQSKKQYFGG